MNTPLQNAPKHYQYEVSSVPTLSWTVREGVISSGLWFLSFAEGLVLLRQNLIIYQGVKFCNLNQPKWGEAGMVESYRVRDILELIKNKKQTKKKTSSAPCHFLSARSLWCLLNLQSASNISRNNVNLPSEDFFNSWRKKNVKIIPFKLVSLSKHKYPHQKVVCPYTTGETPDIRTFLPFFFKKMKKWYFKRGNRLQKHYTCFHKTR